MEDVFNLGILALNAFSRFSNEEDEPNLPALLELTGVLVIGAGTLINKVLSDNELKDSDNSNEEIIERVGLAKVCVSLWAHCCFADGELTKEEDDITDRLIGSLFSDDSLFPQEITNQDFIFKELIEIFNNPLPMKVVVEFTNGNPQLAANFYEEACIIFASDGSVADEERNFLDDLADEFSLSRMDKKSIERKYLKAILV